MPFCAAAICAPENAPPSRDRRGDLAYNLNMPPPRRARLLEFRIALGFAIATSAGLLVDQVEMVLAARRRSINGWVLKDAVALKEPIPCKGELGLWTLRPSQVRKD
jgi:hypothetical protein